jgi:hypothetical protein
MPESGFCSKRIDELYPDPTFSPADFNHVKQQDRLFLIHTRPAPKKTNAMGLEGGYRVVMPKEGTFMPPVLPGVIQQPYMSLL